MLRWRREGASSTAAAFCFSRRPQTNRRRRNYEDVGIPPAVGGIPKGRWELVGSLPLAFHSFQGPVISTALRPPCILHSRGAVGDSTFTWRSSSPFSCRILRADSVSLIRPARCSRLSMLIPGLRNFSASGTRFSLSKGVS